MTFEELRPLIWDVLVQAGRTLTLGEVQAALPHIPPSEVMMTINEMARNPTRPYLVRITREGKRQGRPEWDMVCYQAVQP